MKLLKSILFSLFIFINIIILFPTVSFAAFSTSDLQGTWYGHLLTSGSEEAWHYTTVTIDSQGNISIQTTDINGVTEIKNNVATATLSESGIFTIMEDTSVHGVMSIDKNILVLTETWDDGPSYSLSILVKGGGSFTQSDLQGTWYGHILTSGVEEVWEYMTLTVDSQGDVSVQLTDINGDTESENNVALLSITPDGIMSDSLNSSLHGVMSLDKNIVVFTDTWGDAGTYALTILVKSGGSFAQSDLQGTWQGHTLTTGSEEVWEYDTTTIDSQGLISIQITDSNGNTESNPDEATLSITSNGELSVAGSTTFHGVMSSDKDIAVITETWAAGIYALSIAAKAVDTTPVADFSASQVTGSIPLEVAFSDSSSGDITSWSWDFGDGATSTVQNPTHTYTKAGVYTVSLTVTGSGGSDVVTKTDYINVNSRAMPWLQILLDDTDSQICTDEICDGIDNDCNPASADGSADPQLGASCDGSDSDLCLEGTLICEAGVLVCSDNTTDTLEICDGADNDCDELVDEEDVCFLCDVDPDPPGGECPQICTGGCQDSICNIDCFGSACTDQTIDCPPGFSCHVNCISYDSCVSTTINCPEDYSCEVNCDDDYYCSGLNINCSTEGMCNINCGGAYGCDSALLNCGNDACTAACTGICLGWPNAICGDSCNCSF